MRNWSAPGFLALFPGQGSQKVGMGKELYETESLAREYFDRADAALGFSLTTLCHSGPTDKLTATEIAQPAILTVSTILYQLAKQYVGELQPAAGAGHSLGEYSALVAAEALRFEDAVILVHKRGSYMQQAVPAGQGSMLAILGKEVEEIEASIAQVSEGVVEIANVNAPGQIVVAGATEALAALREVMAGTKIVPLAVSAPFHCALMAPAAERLEVDLKTLAIDRPRFPIYSNVTAQATSEPEKIRQQLIAQVCGRVRWVESMRHAISAHKVTHCVEFGQGAVLTGMMKRISPEVDRYNIESRASIGPLDATTAEA